MLLGDATDKHAAATGRKLVYTEAIIIRACDSHDCGVVHNAALVYGDCRGNDVLIGNHQSDCSTRKERADVSGERGNGIANKGAPLHRDFSKGFKQLHECCAATRTASCVLDVMRSTRVAHWKSGNVVPKHGVGERDSAPCVAE